MKREICLWLIAFLNSGLFGQNPNWQWVNGLFSGNHEIAWDISCDPTTGDVYVGGSFEGGLNNLLGTSFLNTFGQKDGFLTKYSPGGTLIWAIKVGGSSNDEIKAVAADPSGDVYITGTFRGTADFDPSSATFALTASGSGADGFLAKYTSGGAFIWAVKFGNSPDEEVWRMYVNGSGVFLTGAYSSSATFYSTNSNTKSTAATQSGKNFFGVKYNGSGQCSWVVSAGSSKDDSGHDLVADGNRVYFIGDYEDNLTVYDASGVQVNVMPIQNADKADVFILAVSPSGQFEWITNASSNDVDSGNGITQDLTNIYIAGSIKEDAVFPYPSAQFTRNCAGGTDIFIAAISKMDGSYQWVSAQTGSGNSDEVPYEIEYNGNGSLIVTGFFKNTLSYSAFGGTNLNSSGNEDIFTTSFNTSGNYQWGTKAGDNGRDLPHGLTSYNGDIYLCGEYEDSPVFGNFTLTNDGGKNAFLGRTGCMPLGNNTASGSQTICAGSQSVVIAGSVPTGTSAPYSYLWEQSSDGYTWLNASGNYTLQNYSAGLVYNDIYYRRKIVTTQTCGTVPISNTVAVKTNQPPAAIVGTDKSICSASLNLEATPPAAGSGKWTIVQGQAAINSVSSYSTVVSGLLPGKTILRWTVTNGVCPAASDDIVLWRDVPPDVANAGPDALLLTPKHQLAANTPTLGTGKWEIIQGAVTLSSITDPKAHILSLSEGESVLQWTVRNGACPENSDEVLINLKALQIPNAFSPNSDGFNDTFVIPGLEYYDNVKFYVYNRWGSRVYSSEQYKNSWRGTNLDNERLADDTYYFTLEIPGKANYNGFVVLKYHK